jgi:hypothetical protein
MPFFFLKGMQFTLNQLVSCKQLIIGDGITINTAVSYNDKAGVSYKNSAQLFNKDGAGERFPKKHYYCNLLYVMYKINFDIGRIDDDVALSQCRIVMELGADVFNYLVADADNRILKVKYYRLESDDNTAYLEQLEELLKQDALLQQPARDVVVIYQFPESHLVPVPHFNMDQNKALLDLLHGDLNKGVMLSEKVKGWDTYNVYRIGSDLHQLLQRKFTNIRYCHQYSLLLQSLQPVVEEANNSISVSFYSHCFVAAVVQQKELQLIQRFPYHTAEDAAYWLLNIFQQFNFTQEEIGIAHV